MVFLFILLIRLKGFRKLCFPGATCHLKNCFPDRLYRFMKTRKTKWKKGLYLFVRSYLGFYGTYESGKVYKLSSRLAKLFGSSGIIRPVPKLSLKERFHNFFFQSDKLKKYLALIPGIFN